MSKRASRNKSNFIQFLQALIKNPRATGAVLPSSKKLALAMASYVKLGKNLVVELGAGTGMITTSLLECGIPPEQLVLIEYSAILAKLLKKKFKQVKVIEGDAAQVLPQLVAQGQSIDTVISALPLKSFPKARKVEILNQINHALAPGGAYIQFTYDLRHRREFHPLTLHRVHSKIIWTNVPPAKIEVFAPGE